MPARSPIRHPYSNSSLLSSSSCLHAPYITLPLHLVLPTQEPVFRNDDIYFLSRSERYRRSLEKQRRLVEIQKDLSLANGDKQLLRTCVHDDVSVKGKQGSNLHMRVHESLTRISTAPYAPPCPQCRMRTHTSRPRPIPHVYPLHTHTHPRTNRQLPIFPPSPPYPARHRPSEFDVHPQPQGHVLRRAVQQMGSPGADVAGDRGVLPDGARSRLQRA